MPGHWETAKQTSFPSHTIVEGKGKKIVYTSGSFSKNDAIDRWNKSNIQPSTLILASILCKITKFYMGI